MRKITLATILCACALALNLSSCTDETVVHHGETAYKAGNGTVIGYAPSLQGILQAQTRGLQLTAANLSSFGVSASYYTSGTYEDAACGSYIYKEQILAAIGRSSHAWPGAEYTLSFFAYAPYSNLIGVSPAATAGRPVYSYTVPTDIASQVDLMTAEALEVSGEETTDPVPLSFSHRLTDIRFNIYNEGENDITVHSIGVYGLKYAGTYGTGTSWTLTGEANSPTSHPFLIDLADTSDPDDGVTVEPLQDSGELTGGSYHLMALPQTVAAGTRFIEVDATVNSTRQVFHCDLATDMVLSMGQSYNIRLRLGYNHIGIEVLSIEDWTLGSDTSGTPPREREEGTIDAEGIDNWSQQSDESGAAANQRQDSQQEATDIADWQLQD